MPWEAIATIAKVVSAIGVIVSLIYVGLQLRQNNKNLRIATQHAITDSIGQTYRNLQTPGVAKLFLIGIKNFNDLEEERSLQFSGLMGEIYRNYEDIFVQWINKALDENSWKGQRSAMLDILSQPGSRQWWETRRHWYNKKFVKYLESELETYGHTYNENQNDSE